MDLGALIRHKFFEDEVIVFGGTFIQPPLHFSIGDVLNSHGRSQLPSRTFQEAFGIRQIGGDRFAVDLQQQRVNLAGFTRFKDFVGSLG